MRAFLLFAFLLISFVGLGQSPTNTQPLQGGSRSCGTEAYMEQLKQQNPDFEQLQEKIKATVQLSLKQQGQKQHLRQLTEVVTIPVVFHVVYNTSSENISDEQILSQLQILNNDFRRLNADTVNTPSYFQPYAADTRVEFCLAAIDPNGDPTTGITRTQTSKTSFSYIKDEVKSDSEGGVDNWDPTQYLNVWICNISNNILGYATFPGAPANTDGVVIHYNAVGSPPANRYEWSYNLGRTATHEIGHWLGLNHIWGAGSTCNDSDEIEDTPNQLEESVDCPEGIVVSCDNEPYGNMYQNFMDYTNDACMNMFTQGQAAYINAVVNSSRNSVINSLACSGILRADFSTAVASDTLTIAGSTVVFADSSEGARPTAWLWEFEGGIPATSTEQNPKVTYPHPGEYNVKLTISNERMSSTELKEAYVQVTVKDLVIYPNPASDYITIEQPARIYVHHVQLVNSVGKVVLDAEVQDRVLQMDVHHLAAGIYFLRLTSTNGTSVKKVSVVK
ncbi:M43 family zinc metalloprotease [Pontibacter silvestris]|uniref:M43 family zinc metalloprotease n=1 Tax=Pontibacter silvestris TaxID=2305183 RepID=A0ABW4X2K6_9BACT|nr:M43 family zinc metalloprotease [Pontibacter silvestris]MCC9135733.1 PKD domain-containing protein [Pontibacter silvestris]